MAAPAISHLICTSVLVALILLLPFFYGIVADNIELNMIQRELQEISDYVSNTLANLYFLVNMTDYSSTSLEKELIYLPSTVENSIYTVTIESVQGNVSKITSALKFNRSVAASAWVTPGLKPASETSVEGGGRKVVAGCSRNATGAYILIKYG